MNEVTFASFLTPAGVVIAAGIVTTFIELGKKVFPAIYDRVNGLQQSFILTAGLYVLVGLSIAPDSLDDLLGVFLAWLSCATSAVGFYELGSRTVDRLTEEKPPTIIGKDEKFDDEK
jgi:hypothetical protein